MKRFTAKKIFILCLMILGVFLALSFVNAQGLSLDAEVGEQSGLFSGSITVIAVRLINAGLGILGLIAVMIVLYGGYLYMTARGEAERVQKAKKLLIQAVIGLLIIASAYAITSFLIYILTGGSGDDGNRNIIPPPPPPSCIGDECGCIGPNCVGCPNPNEGTPNSAYPYICSVKPAEQAKGGLLTISGKNFGAYDIVTTPSSSKVTLVKDDVRYQAEVAVCPGDPASKPKTWNDLKIKVIVPDNLPFDPAGNNEFKVYVENGGQSSDDYHLDSDFAKLRNSFILADKTPSPEFICITPDNAAEEAEVQVYGKFMGTAEDNDLFFNKDNNDGIKAVSSSWTPDKIVSLVPEGAIYGEVYIADKTTGDELSDGEDFWVTCSNVTSPYDCQSGCCRKITSYASNICDLANRCGSSGIGAKCSSATCQTSDPACNPGLICDSSKCTCREPEAGDSCGPNNCINDNTTCGANLACGQDCKCAVPPQITAVTPGNGTPGNYVTISGKGFGSLDLGNNLIVNSGFEDTRTPWKTNVSTATKISSDTSFSGGKSLMIDLTTSKVSPYTFYYPIYSLLEANKGYSVSFKLKGSVDKDIAVRLNAEFGDLASIPLPCPANVWPNKGVCLKDSTRCCKNRNSNTPQTETYQDKALFTIPEGNYQNWQTFSGSFIFDNAMQNWVDSYGYSVNIGMLFYVSTDPAKFFSVYLDDFEIKEIASTGTVTFCGTNTDDPDVNTDKCGDSDDKIAKLPHEINSICNADDSWQNNEILVVVPAGGVTGPIKVTTPSGLSAQTSPAPSLPAVSDFQFNGIKRPALCGLSPNVAPALSPNYIKAIGTGFRDGTCTGLCGGDILVGNPGDNKRFDSRATYNFWNWTDQSILNLSVPNLKAGTVPVWVKVGTEISNPVAFKITRAVNAPTIDNVDPAQGPTGQYITIQGSGFGKLPGTVKFKAGTSATDPANWAVGDSNFPQACASKYWSDTEIIIKVPAGADIDPTNGGIVVIPNGSSLTSNKSKFSRCERNNSTCPLAPGICAIVPSKAPIGASNVVFYGDNFGNYDTVNSPSNSRIIFSSDKPVLNLDENGIWTDKQIGFEISSESLSDPIIVPEGAISGNVLVRDANGIAGNKVNFEVVDCREQADICEGTDICCEQTGACTSASLCLSSTEKSCDYKYTFTTVARTIVYGAPTVIENYTCDNELNQSPSPWKNPTNSRDFACVNSVIYARFSIDMDPATLTNANIILNSCASDGQGNVVAGTCSTPPIALDPDSVDISSNDFSIAPLVDLAPSTWYQVTLKDTITSAAPGSKNLDGNNDGIAGGDYIWQFKTGDSAEDCQVDSVNVTPNKANIIHPTDTIAYNGRVRAVNCNMLNGNAFDWNWYKLYCPIPSLPIDPAKVPMCARGAREAAQLVNLGGLAKISLNTITVSGKISSKQIVTPVAQGGVYIAAEVDNKSDDTNLLNINLNLPIITGFSPKDGIIRQEVNSYVDIIGNNFGASQGQSKVYFEKNSCAVGETICWTEANLANCDQSWTNTAVKVIVPKDVQDGGWIRIETPFGEDTTDFDNNNQRDAGEVFIKSENLFPFICQLSPNIGSNGINVTVIGDNFGDKNKIKFNNVDYGIGSYINFDPFSPAIVEDSKIRSWSNSSIIYTNPLTDLAESTVEVFVTIDPYSEPYNDTNKNGIYDGDDPYADTNNSGAYSQASYTVNGIPKNNLESNRVNFDQPPIITKLSPNNGPVEQWVTIIGKNFGSEEGEVYFGEERADLALCEIEVWTGNRIIAQVPAGLDLGEIDVYIITKKGIDSTRKPFTVNTNPLGAGLCSIDPESGAIGTAVMAHGIRFDETKGNNNLVFANNLPADTTLWNDSDIEGNVPLNAVSGEVIVVKKVKIGEECTSFIKWPWCASGIYEDIFQDAPSNGIYFTVETDESALCQTDADCKIPNRCVKSTCINNRCTPEIIRMNPASGPVGQWVDIEGCYLGCQAGDVYFKSNFVNVQMPTNGLLAGYNFNSGANNGFVGGSIAIGSLAQNASISNGVLTVPASGFLDLDDRLADPATYGGVNGKMTLFLKFKTDTAYFRRATNWNDLFYEVGGISQLMVYPSNLATAHFTTITMDGTADRTRSDSNINNKLIAGQWNSLVVVFEAGVGLKYYINGSLTDQISIPNLKMLRATTNSKLGSVNSNFTGEIDDFYVYNRALTAKEINALLGVKALTPSDANGSCTNNWTCSSNLQTSYDLITAEVPNKKTALTADDAVTGMVTLQTRNGDVLDVGNFTVNTDTDGITDQVCKLVTCGNGTIDAGEECDAANLNGESCESLDLGDGDLACKSNCSFNYSDCSLAALCGNEELNGTCSKIEITDKETCVTTSIYTWDGAVCSNSVYKTQETCLAVKNTWSGEQCDGNPIGAVDGIFAPDYYFEYDQTCSDYGAPEDNCTRKCSTKCKTLICNKVGQDCSVPSLCGNERVDGTCSNTSITDYQTCVTTEKSIYTWNGTSCSNPNYLTKSACEADKNIWTGEQCDCGTASCFNPLTAQTDCSAPKTWLNSRCVDTGLTTMDDCLAVAGNRWDWDCTDKLSTCSAFNYGSGNLGCKINTCKLNTSDCETAPDTTGPFVEKTLPDHNEDNFCRNGIIDIYFNELLDPATITQENFILGSCTGGPLVKEGNGLFNKAFAYLKNILFKLAGYKTQALAVEDNCAFVPFAPGDYTATYTNINNTWDASADPPVCSNPLFDIESCHPKTVVYLELAETDIFAAHKTYNVKILPAVADKAGNQLDLSYHPSPMIITDGEEAFDGYAFGFETAGDPDIDGSGICDIDDLDILVYHDEYDADEDRIGVLASNEQPRDLFRCAGINDCALEAGNTVTADYDQDRQTSGNQHIYKAIASSSANAGGFHLSMYAQWSRSDQSDPAKMLTLYNKTTDSNPDVNIVRNTNGVVYTTINKIADKENTGLMVIEAQARGSQIDPEYRILEINYLGCAYPWRFDRDDYGNSKTWYCRDAEPLLPDAGIVIPE